MSKIEKLNGLIKMSYGLSPIQHRALNLVFTQLKRQLESEENLNNDKFSFSLSEVTTSSQGGKDYRKIRESLKETTGILFEELSSDGNSWKAFVAVQAVEVDTKSSEVTFRVGADLLERFVEHHGNGFITATPELFLELKSSYSMRLYELFKMYSEVGRTDAEKNVEWLRKWFNLKEGTYALFSDFRKSILEKAQAELATLEPPVLFDMEMIKKGRSVVAVRFSNIQIQGKREKVPVDPVEIALKTLGAKPEVLKPLMAGLEREDLLTVEFFHYVGEQIESNNTEVKAVTPWLMAALPDLILRYDKKQRKQPKSVKNLSKNIEDERKATTKRQNKAVEAPKEHERAVRAWNEEPKVVKELVRAQMSENGGSFHFLSDIEVYKILKDRISYDTKTKTACLMEDLFENKTKGMSFSN